MQNLLNIEANFEYLETESDLSKCVTCEQVIIGKMFQMVIFINNDPVYSKYKFCESCYTEVNGKKKDDIGGTSDTD